MGPGPGPKNCETTGFNLKLNIGGVRATADQGDVTGDRDHRGVTVLVTGVNRDLKP